MAEMRCTIAAFHQHDWQLFMTDTFVKTEYARIVQKIEKSKAAASKFRDVKAIKAQVDREFKACQKKESQVNLDSLPQIVDRKQEAVDAIYSVARPNDFAVRQPSEHTLI